MELKDSVENVVKRLMDDKDLKKRFDKDPAGVIEDILGVDLPNELVNEVVDLVKAQLTAEKVGDALEALGGLFKKKS